MIVDANDPDKVRLILERELENMMTRHDAAAGLYEKHPHTPRPLAWLVRWWD